MHSYGCPLPTSMPPAMPSQGCLLSMFCSTWGSCLLLPLCSNRPSALHQTVRTGGLDRAGKATSRSILPLLWLHRGALNAPERWRSVAATPSLASLPGTRRYPRAGPICLPPRHAPTTTALPLILGSPEPRERGGEMVLVAAAPSEGRESRCRP
jgi:hypothetical protein